MEFEKVKEILSEKLNINTDKITEKTHLTKDLGLDSLDIFQLISEIEDTFGIEFTGEAAEKIKTVGDAVNYIRKSS